MNKRSLFLILIYTRKSIVFFNLRQIHTFELLTSIKFHN